MAIWEWNSISLLLWCPPPTVSEIKSSNRALKGKTYWIKVAQKNHRKRKRHNGEEIFRFEARPNGKRRADWAVFGVFSPFWITIEAKNCVIERVRERENKISSTRNSICFFSSLRCFARDASIHTCADCDLMSHQIMPRLPNDKSRQSLCGPSLPSNPRNETWKITSY